MMQSSTGASLSLSGANLTLVAVRVGVLAVVMVLFHEEIRVSDSVIEEGGIYNVCAKAADLAAVVSDKRQ